MIEEVTYYDGDVLCIGLVAKPIAFGQSPAILVCHEGPGIGDHVRRRIEQLAEAGFVAFAADIYGGGAPLLSTMPDIGKRLMPWLENRPALRTRARAGLQAMAQLPEVNSEKMFAIGFCFGGTTVLELARDGAPLLGVASFHGMLPTTHPAAHGAVKASVLSCTGALDQFIGLDDRNAFEKEMTEAGAQWRTMLFANAKHAFTNKDAPDTPNTGYNEEAATESWGAMEKLFASLLKKA